MRNFLVLQRLRPLTRTYFRRSRLQLKLKRRNGKQITRVIRFLARVRLRLGLQYLFYEHELCICVWIPFLFWRYEHGSLLLVVMFSFSRVITSVCNAFHSEDCFFKIPLFHFKRGKFNEIFKKLKLESEKDYFIWRYLIWASEQWNSNFNLERTSLSIMCFLI